MIAPVNLAMQVFFPLLSNRLRVKKAFSFQSRFIDQVFGPIAKRSAQPVADRNTESNFRSFEQFAGNVPGQDVSQDSFSAASLNFERVGQ